MIKNLDYKITFSNDRVIERTLNLSAGSTLITGRNGQGKSLNFEMVAFGLFGTTALRGANSDYKRISLTLSLKVRDTEYVIKRTKTKSEVFVKDEKVVSGTSPVNTWVMNTLGYGYDVFRIAHWCAQGDIQALANMRPTERKAMIDSVAGLTQMDVLAETIKQDSRVLKSEIDAATRTVVLPVPPVKPDLDLETVKANGEQVQQARDAWNRLVALTPPSQPMAPEKPSDPVLPKEPQYLSVTAVKPDAPQLSGANGEIQSKTFEEVNATIDAEMPVIKSLIVEREAMERQFNLLYPFTEKRHKFPRGFTNRDKLKESWDLWHKKLHLVELEKSDTFACPHCEGEVSVAQEQIDALKALDLPDKQPPITLDEFDEIKTNAAKVAEFKEVEKIFNVAELTALRDKLFVYEDYRKTCHQYSRDLKQYDQAVQQVQRTNASLKSDHEHRVTQVNNQYRNEMLRYESLKANYQAAQGQYELALSDYNAQMTIKQGLIDKWGDTPARTLQAAANVVNDQLAQLSRFDAEQAVYIKQKQAYDLVQEGVADQQAQLEDLNRAKEALREVKSRVQTHLIPSLNRVASYLVDEMTGGEFTQVFIDDQFEVYVDKQPLRTLSGSGKDIANLALRIGLGRILTHKVLPLMMLDEIDSAMDSERASFTWDCIKRITPNIGQVLQASHKELEAETVVTV